MMPVPARETPVVATLIGLVAIVAWGCAVGLIKSVSVSFGPIAGAALIYSLAALLLALTTRRVPLRAYPRRYLVWGSVLFVGYELCLALSIGYSNGARQAIEVGMVNYLWPSFTLVAAIIVNRQRATWLIVPGVAMSLLGVVWVLGGDQGLDMAGMARNVRTNPLSYGLAFVGAIIWAAYCIVTPRLAGGKDGIMLFFAITGGVLWVKLALTGGGQFTLEPLALLMLVLAASTMALGYATWNIGILHGHVTLLATASYFTPVLSAAIAAIVLQSSLTLSFWQGVGMICLGSLSCWLATRWVPKTP